MGTCVNHAVGGIFVGHIAACFSGIKGKLQDFHPRIPRIFQKLADGVRHIPQIFCYNRQISQFLFNLYEQIDSHALFPVPVYGGAVSIRNGIVGIKAPEMVNAYNIKQFKLGFQPVNPPAVSGLFVICPVIQRIAPELSPRRKCVRRAAGNGCRQPVFIQLEQLWIGPYIHTVKRNINRYIPDDFHVFFIGILFQSQPLFAEQILNEHVKTDFAFQLCLIFRQRRFVPQTHILIPVRPA